LRCTTTTLPSGIISRHEWADTERSWFSERRDYRAVLSGGLRTVR